MSIRRLETRHGRGATRTLALRLIERFQPFAALGLEHPDINEAMLASGLAPEGVLMLRAARLV